MAHPLLTRRASVFALATLCCLLWGSAYPAVKAGYAMLDIAPSDMASQLLFAGWRFLLAGVILPFTPPGEKILRGVKNLIRPPVPVAPTVDEEDLERQLEARLRKEFEEDLEKQLAEFKKQAAAEAKRKAERPTEPAALPPISSHTASSGGDVRTLRSGIPFKTEVKVGKGGIASKERSEEHV